MLEDLSDPEKENLPPADIDESMVVRAVSSFSNGSAPGPTGTRSSQIKSFIRASVAFTKQLTLLGGSELFALREVNSGLRPLACSDIYQRVTAKVGLGLVKEDSEKFFTDHKELGVSVKGGGEGCVHIAATTARKWRADKMKDKIIVKIDAATLSVRRKHILELVHEHVPAVYRWIDACYAKSTRLYFGEYIIMSQEGVQQGDPCKPS